MRVRPGDTVGQKGCGGPMAVDVIESVEPSLRFRRVVQRYPTLWGSLSAAILAVTCGWGWYWLDHAKALQPYFAIQATIPSLRVNRSTRRQTSFRQFGQMGRGRSAAP